MSLAALGWVTPISARSRTRRQSTCRCCRAARALSRIEHPRLSRRHDVPGPSRSDRGDYSRQRNQFPVLSTACSPRLSASCAWTACQPWHLPWSMPLAKVPVIGAA